MRPWSERDPHRDHTTPSSRIRRSQVAQDRAEGGEDGVLMARKKQNDRRAEQPVPTSPVWANRIVGYGEEPPEQLLANEKNWRVHPKAQQEALKGALRKV